jgi:predicted dehydrogenase
VKQLFQDMRSGETILADVPTPQLRPGLVMVRTHFSVVSAGTERMVMELGKKGYLAKARARPDLAMKVLKKVKTEGLASAFRQTMAKLEAPLPLGYSSSGVVEAVGEGVFGISPGDRVSCAGSGWAAHAEVVVVPRNLCVRVPPDVGLRDAAYATVGAIALQGVRVADVRVGETVVVIGLGIVGQVAAQILKAAGCTVVAFDPDEERAEVARRWVDVAVTTEEDAVRETLRHSRDRGADSVVVTAATASSAPIALAAEVARDRAVVSVVGATGLEVPRDAYYHKELDLRISRSYGPGRYDAAYEERGHDYPVGYVRWTESRNLEAFLDLAAAGRLDLEGLTTHRFGLDDSLEAYRLLEGHTGTAGGGPVLGMVFEYPVDRSVADRVVAVERSVSPSGKDRLGVGLIGAGGFATGTLIPALVADQDVRLVGVTTAGGLTAAQVARKHGFLFAAGSPDEVIGHADVDVVFIATPHDSHASLAARALRAGKHVFVEKPLAIDRAQLAEVAAAAEEADTLLMTGFNRRFSSLTADLVGLLRARGGPFQISIMVNAGPIPADHWIQDPSVGGGRIIGEACHFLDLAQHLAGSPIVSTISRVVPAFSGEGVPPDNMAVLSSLADGSVASIQYYPSGATAFPKEQIWVSGCGMNAYIDNWTRLQITDGEKTKGRRARGQDKGHAAEIRAFLDACRSGGGWPISLADQLAATEASFDAAGIPRE